MRNLMLVSAMAQAVVVRSNFEGKQVVEFKKRATLSAAEYAAEARKAWAMVKTEGFSAAIAFAEKSNLPSVVRKLADQRSRVEFNNDFARAEQGVSIDDAIELAEKAGHFVLANRLKLEKMGIKNPTPLTEEENEKQAIAIARARYAKAA